MCINACMYTVSMILEYVAAQNNSLLNFTMYEDLQIFAPQSNAHACTHPTTLVLHNNSNNKIYYVHMYIPSSLFLCIISSAGISIVGVILVNLIAFSSPAGGGK